MDYHSSGADAAEIKRDRFLAGCQKYPISQAEKSLAVNQVAIHDYWWATWGGVILRAGESWLMSPDLEHLKQSVGEHNLGYIRIPVVYLPNSNGAEVAGEEE